MKLDAIVDAMQSIGSLVELVKYAVEAVRRGEPERVADIIPAQLRTSIARAVAEAKAREKFSVSPAMLASPGEQGDGHQ